MKKSVYIKTAVLILLFVVCYGRSYLAYAKLQRNFDCISVRVQDQAVTKKQLLRAQELMKEQEESHIPEFAAYKITEHAQIGEPNLERTTEVNLYGVYGQMKLVTPSEICAGNFPVTEDYDGCVIDEDSAYKLFGTSNVVGQIITMDQKITVPNRSNNTAADPSSQSGDGSVNADNGQNVKIVKKKYMVRGVIKAETPILMIQAREESSEFWNLEFDYGDLQQGRTYADKFMSSYNLAGKYIIIEQNFIGDVIGNILVIPVFILFLFVFISCVRKIHRVKETELKEILRRQYRLKRDWMILIGRVLRKSILPLIQIALACTALVLTWRWVGIFPMRYLPTKWSDFDQYVRFYDQIRNRLNDLSYVAPTRREVLLKQECMISIFFGAAAILLEWHILDVVRGSKKKENK